MCLWALVITSDLRRYMESEIRTENDVARALGVDWATIRGWQERRIVPRFELLEPVAFLEWCRAVYRGDGRRLTAPEIRHFQRSVAMFELVPALIEDMHAVHERFPEVAKWVRFPSSPEKAEAATAVNRLVALTNGMLRKNGKAAQEEA